MLHDFSAREAEEMKVLHADFLSRGGYSKEIAGLGSSGDIPHGHVVVFRDHFLDGGVEVRQGRAYHFYKVREAGGPVSFAGHLFVAAINEAGSKYFGGDFQISAI